MFTLRIIFPQRPMLEVVQKLPHLNWRIKLEHGQPLSGVPRKMIWVVTDAAYLPIWAFGICSLQRLEISPPHSQEFIHWSLISLSVSSLGTPCSTEAFSSTKPLPQSLSETTSETVAPQRNSTASNSQIKSITFYKRNHKPYKYSC